MTALTIWDIPGGIHPPERKDLSNRTPIQPAPLPRRLVLPLSQHLGAPAEPCVAVGERVLKGQKIAEAQGTVSVPLHAPTSGTVSFIGPQPYPHASGMTAPAIVIDSDGQDEWINLQPHPDFRALEPAALLELIREAGINGLGGAGFPTAAKLGARPAEKIHTLIINGTECEPYITADDVLMRHHAADILQGVQLLSFILDAPQEILIAIEDNKPEAIEAMCAAVAKCNDSRMEVVPLPTKYPSGGEKQLVQILTGQEVPSGALPAQLGVVCQNVATVLAAWRAVRFGEPLIERITTVTGEAFANQRNLRLRIGTPIDFVLQQQGHDASRASRLVMGGPMMGFNIVNAKAPVIKTTNCLLAPTLEEAPPPGPAQACIRCGMCAEVCPSNLLPQQLYWYARAEDEEKLQAHNLFDCIECGVCSYVCPSEIPLVQFYRAAKGEIRRHEAEKKHADRARRRFEFHKQRIEDEKAARARAREEALEKTRLRAQEKAAAEAAGPANVDKTKLLTNALAKAKQAAGADQRERLERKLLAADDRLEKLQKQEALAETPEQGEALRARIREAELACKAIRDKLATLPGSQQTENDKKAAQSVTAQKGGAED